MIAIIDYGMGNLRSVQKALEKVGATARITQDTTVIRSADKVVLPGVGAMQPAMEKLAALGLIPAIKEAIASEKPFLGICLGFQLLFERSSEGGSTSGLGALKGSVERFSSLKIPQIGWNQLKIKKNGSPLLKGIEQMSHVYFCHSYFVLPSDPGIIAATTQYGIDFASSIAAGNLFGVQFHPEKSQTVGLRILKNFHEL
ncbi:MAG TPA: imidazole glycerol phosphate synthase subunit HisH [Candidatus Omnitrophota bacterium]|nr:imidazole glycerol phosphate synthase subunit HisH [Candidatus Omnitrophota bacterium]